MLVINKRRLSKEQLLFAEHIGLKLSDDGYDVFFEKGNELSVEVLEKKIVVSFSKKVESFRGLSLLKNTNIKVGTKIVQKARFKNLAAQCDCSRNSVPKIETLKKYILDIASLGFNQLYLYTEDTFEVKEYPYFGYLRGRYSGAEIKELDSFAALFGVELIPAVQTLAHLNAIFHWKEFENIHDISDILLCDDEKTYEFLDKMISSVREMYSTDKINIGMDEAHLLGLGKYLDNNGYTEKLDIFMKHINRVVEIVRKYNFKPMMWSDMYFKIAVGKCNYDMLAAVDISDDAIKLIPSDMTLVYWNYSSADKLYFDNMISCHKKMKRDIAFAGGFRKWVGFCPNLEVSFNSSRVALQSMVENGVDTVIMTGWGDNGAEGALYLTLPGLVMFSESCYSDNSDEVIDEKLKTLFGYSLEDFRKLQLPNFPNTIVGEQVNIFSNAHKPILWNDPLVGVYDRHILEGYNGYFAKISKELEALMKKGNRFSYLFETIYYMCDFLSEKSELGNMLRRAYKSGNKAKLKELLSRLPIIIEKLDAFHQTFRKNWMHESKPFGFDVQDMRFGTLRARLVYTAEVLEDYLCGKTDSIPELDEDILYYDCRKNASDLPLHTFINDWSSIATVNVLK